MQNSTSPAYEWSAIDAQPASVYGEANDPAVSCKRILEERPDVRSGVFTLASSGTPFQVYCDMQSFGGGWTMVYSVGCTAAVALLTATGRVLREARAFVE